MLRAEERGRLRPPSSARAAASPGGDAASLPGVSCLGGMREQIGKLMSLFLTLRTVHLPQALSQISLHKASQQQSPTLGPAKKQPPCPELGVTNPSLL